MRLNEQNPRMSMRHGESTQTNHNATLIPSITNTTSIGPDARFPNVNQTKHCWQNYVDYHKCVIAKGEDFAPCRQVSSVHAHARYEGEINGQERSAQLLIQYQF